MLWNEKLRQEFAEKSGVAPELLKDRRSGRSTLLAFEAVAACYRYRGEWIEVRDHYGTYASHQILFNAIFRMLATLRQGGLEFDGFEFDKLNLRMRLTA
jgi:hypothetical protein